MTPLSKSPKNIALVFLLIACLVFAFFLMFIGFLKQQVVIDGTLYELSTGEAFYASANLLLDHELISPEEMQYHTIWIILGQFLGYIAFYGAILLLVWGLLRSWFAGVRVRFLYKNHWVVCDLNAQGQAFIHNALQADPKLKCVVLLPELDEETKLFAKQAVGRIKLIQGDAGLIHGLSLAAVNKAKKLIVCTDSLDRNLQITHAVTELFANQPNKRPKKMAAIDLYVSIPDQLLANQIGHESYAHFLQPHPAVNMQIYTPESLVARHYFRYYPPHIQADWQQQNRVHLVFAGGGDLVSAMIYHYAQISPYKQFEAPIFTLLGPKAVQEKKALLKRFPAFASVEEGTAIEQGLGCIRAIQADAAFNLTTEQLDQVAAVAPPTAILFCGREGEHNFKQALRLHHNSLLHNRWHAPFYIYLDHAQGVQSLLESVDSPYPAEQLIPFGVAEAVFNLSQLDQLDENARFVHEAYRRTQMPDIEQYASASLPDNLKPWADLPETYRSSSRRTGDHLLVKLASIGCHIEPQGTLILSESIRLNQPEARLDLLSRLEHQSWCYERLLSAWRYAPQRNNERRLHPSLCAWEDLSATEQYKDVSQIENVRESLMEQYDEHAITARQALVIGLIGHNYVTLEQAQAIKAQLCDTILPALQAAYPEHYFTLLTPLAAGSDFILAQTALQWLEAENIPARLVVVQAIKLDKVIEDYHDNWAHGATWDGVSQRESAAQTWPQGKQSILQQFQHLIHSDACHAVIDLSLVGDAVEANACAYERAGRYIIERADELIAVFDSTRQRGGRGGTGESLDAWEQKPLAVQARVIDIADV